MEKVKLGFSNALGVRDWFVFSKNVLIFKDNSRVGISYVNAKIQHENKYKRMIVTEELQKSVSN